MKTIEILGTGCPKCQQLADNAETAVRQLGVPYEIKKVMDVNTITEYGVMMTPALVVDGEVKVVGKVPPAEEIQKLLT